MNLIAQQCLQFWWVRLSLQQTYNQFEGSMSSEDQDCTNDDSQIYDSPPKNTKTQSCPDSSVTEYRHSRMQDLNQMFIKFKEEQTQIVSHKIKQLQKNRKQSIVVVVIVISLLLIPIYVLDSQVKQLSFRVNELQYREKELLSEVKQLQVGLTELNQMDQALQSSLLNINQEILDLHMNELLKKEKSMLILQKYTSSFDFSIDFKNTNFKDNFAEDAASRWVRKRSGQEVMFYSKQPIPNAGVYYFKVKVEETELGMIGIGIMPAQKRNQKCVYCDSSQIYYIYCKNAQIYNGEFFNLVNKSKKSKFSTIESGDTLTIFVDTKENQVTWYVNSQYAGSQTIKESNKEWYPFVQMTTRGDQVKFVD